MSETESVAGGISTREVRHRRVTELRDRLTIYKHLPGVGGNKLW